MDNTISDEEELIITLNIKELKKPITGEIIDNKMLLIRDNEVIGELPIFNESGSTLIFLDAFNNIIP